MPPGLPRRSMISPSASRLASIASPNCLSTLTGSKKMLSETYATVRSIRLDANRT